MTKIKEWIAENAQYWEEVSEDYKCLYDTEWSDFENKFISEELEHLKFKPKSKILDLGCGLGLGYELCRNQILDIEYHGIDISKGMIRKCRDKYPYLRLRVGAMSDLSKFPDDYFDGVISIFTSFSYTEDINKTVQEIKRVLKNDGVILISVISRFSMRRFLKLNFKRNEHYQSRKSRKKSFSNSWTFSAQELKLIFEVAGFENIEVIGYNAFASLFENPLLWKLNKYISQLFPNLSHELIIKAKYNAEE
jgi:ubiquinone/menaquinone biosynthesis C-methylase UbiE